jgi:hypothetical protein
MRRVVRVGVVLAVVAAALGAPSMANAERHRDPLARYGISERAQAQAASNALQAAQDVVHGRNGKAVHNRDYTLKLRDLRVLRAKLSTRDRKAADRLLARPNQAGDDDAWSLGSLPTKICGVAACVHYLDADDSANDGNPDAATDDFAQTALADASYVLQTYTDAGYRAPESDATSPENGGDNRLDIYLADIGPELFGYCTSDDPKPLNSVNGYDTSAYCVLDNDYAVSQFGDVGNQLKLLDVTLAHELFHAVQFGYDLLEDGWLMEATATWAEDELFDDVNDNRNFLADGPLGRPGHSLDLFEENGLFQYGAWVFFRFLSERYPATEGDLPVIIKSIWDKADGRASAPNRDADAGASIFAVKSALASVDSTRSFRSIFREFSEWNRHPEDVYSEGADWVPDRAVPSSSTRLTPSSHSRDWSSFKLAQLASRTVEFKPSSMSASDWKLKLSVNLPSTGRGSAASAVVFRKDGTVGTYVLTLSPYGNASRKVPFSSSSVKYVQLVVSNAGLHYACWQDPATDRSCGGSPLDHNLTNTYKVNAFRD